MKKGLPPPKPSGSAPVMDKDVAEIVKKKMSAPRGPPPQGIILLNFLVFSFLCLNYFIFIGMTGFKPKLSSSPIKEENNRNNYNSDEEVSVDITPTKQNTYPSYSSSPKRYDDDDDDYDYNKYKLRSNRSNYSEERHDQRRGRSISPDIYSKRYSSRSQSPEDRAEAEYKPSERLPTHKDRDGSTKKEKDIGSKLYTTPSLMDGMKSNSNSNVQKLSFQPILKATYRELRNFVLSPCQVGFTTRCYIERNRNGTNIFAPFYSLCADLEDGTGRELIVCKKVLISTGAHYVFSLKSEDLYRRREQRSRLYLGKLRSTSPNEYVLYDNGICTPDGKDEDNAMMMENTEEDNSCKREEKGGASLFRKELAVCYFNTKQRPAPEGIRGCEVCIPFAPLVVLDDTNLSSNADSKSPPILKPNTNTPSNLITPFTKIRSSGKQNSLLANKLFIMHEKTSRYDPISSCLVDFKGRANIASIKNFQLLESDPKTSNETGFKSDHEKDFIMQLGKVN